MLKRLERREHGIVSPAQIYQAESSRRARCLHLSKYFDVQRVHAAGINSLDLDPVEHRHLLSGGGDGTIAIHDVHNTSGTPQFTYPSVSKIGHGNRNCHKYAVTTVQWYPVDTGLFLSSSVDKSLRVWDANSLAAAGQFEFGGSVYSHHMSPVATGHCLVAVGVAESKQVHLVDLKSGSKAHTLLGHRKSIMAVQWSSRDELLLATAGKDGIIRFWDIRSAKSCLMLLDQHNGDTTAGPHSVSTAHSGAVNGLCFLPDGLHLLSFGTDSELRLWDTQTGRNRLVNYGRIFNKKQNNIKFSVSDEGVASVAFVPSDGNIEVYDIFNGNRIGILRGHYNQVNCCTFDVQLHELYSGANDRNILIWMPDTETVRGYEEFLNSSRQGVGQRRTNFTSRIGGMADAWSSDED